MIKFIDQEENLRGKLLIISYGRTPTIAGDYLITGNGFKRIAFYHSDYLEPSVGYLHEKIENGSLGLPGQLYMLDNVVILQIRTSIRFGRSKDFVHQLREVLVNHFINEQFEMLFLSSLPYEIRPDIQIQSRENNVYYCEYSEKKRNKMNLLPLSDLLSVDEEQKDILASVGFMKHSVAEFKGVNIFGLFVFSNQIVQKTSALLLAKGLRNLAERKQLSGNLAVELLF